MTVDVSTLFLVTIYVEAILGLLLLFAWMQNSAIRAVAWWGGAHLLRAGSITLFGMYGAWPDMITIDLANAILLTSFAVTWTGARVFDGRRPMPIAMIAGAVLWLIGTHFAFTSTKMELRALVSAGIIAGYTWATAAEFWRGRAEPLVSRLPATFLLFAHGALFLLRTPLSMLLPWSPTNQVFGSVWLTVLSSEALLFSISIAFILLAMAKERTEYRHKTASMIDQLTGISNRRGFLAECDTVTRRQAEEPRLTAVLLADLDRFKSINDRFGHAVGDKVLQVFADTTGRTVRPSDIVGRLGGEEFAAVLYDIGRERALVMAEDIRSRFADAASLVEGRPIDATVSIGMVLTDDPALDVPKLLRHADQALYRAKERGRNRVELASLEPRGKPGAPGPSSDYAVDAA
ncbi:GGDEF domain-containing protein [Rhodoplanes sp. TEM]|uniref:GGDEF domain-containing protein n=1 Tax=Rhodoplanes tepidamans TaxID=200616 RepID=A0ABT5JGX4_RHOTP|nr:MULTISPECIES: GGDEF domain-containing protein [Rhodoplanes]MDC7788852.1 GGDEF domain-containing protein [Rhodoplanes tepidamans]MDC7986483.1 GGDEF domain-containing protein [Rhodoplanes sp. TEM]MDQ0357476.1 diguanylate cyclase (GGDEF)-like protein [Rhodoplanes tepidamans]